MVARANWKLSGPASLINEPPGRHDFCTTPRCWEVFRIARNQKMRLGGLCAFKKDIVVGIAAGCHLIEGHNPKR